MHAEKAARKFACHEITEHTRKKRYTATATTETFHIKFHSIVAYIQYVLAGEKLFRKKYQPAMRRDALD